MSQLFPKMVEILQPGESGNAKISHFAVSEALSRFSSLRPGEYTAAGDYIQLRVGGVLMMSDTRNEHMTNLDVSWRRSIQRCQRIWSP